MLDHRVHAHPHNPARTYAQCGTHTRQPRLCASASRMSSFRAPVGSFAPVRIQRKRRLHVASRVSCTYNAELGRRELAELAPRYGSGC